MIIRQVAGEERFQARLIATVAFHGRMEDPEKAREESLRETEQDWGAFDTDGTLMAHIINNQFTVFLDGKTVSSGGVGAVSTLPEYRNSGAIREIFREMLPSAYAKGEVISTLYPFSHAFYRKFGYETVCWKNEYTFPPEVLQEYRFSGKATLWKPGDPTDVWTALYNRFAAGYNLALRRDEKRMAERLKGEYFRDRKFAYLLYEGEKPAAYVIFQDIRHDPQAILEVRDLAWDGREGLLAILGFLARFSADYGTIRLFLPRDLELLSLIHSPKAYDISKTTSQNFMARVINAEKALATIRKPAGCRFTIRVSDEWIAENNGTWLVTEEGATPTGEAPDLTVTEKAMSQLICGAVSLAEAAYRTDVTIAGNRDTLEKVFERKPILVEDYY